MAVTEAGAKEKGAMGDAAVGGAITLKPTQVDIQAEVGADITPKEILGDIPVEVGEATTLNPTQMGMEKEAATTPTTNRVGIQEGLEGDTTLKTTLVDMAVQEVMMLTSSRCIY